MSIRLRNICMRAGSKDAPGPLFENLNLEMAPGARLGVLGLAKSGKSTLLRLICGTATPDEGVVMRHGLVSWPIPLATIFLGDISVSQNIRFFARLYGIEDESFPRRIAELVEIDGFLNVPLKECPKKVRPRLAFAIGIGIDFDVYLFDGSLTGGEKEFKEKAAGIVTDRLAGHGYVLAAGTPKEVGQYCDSVYVLEAGQARYFAQTEEGVDYFNALLAAEKKKAESAAAARDNADDEDDEGGVLGDVNVLGNAVADVVD